MRFSLRARLTLGFLVAIVATGALVALLSNLIIVNRFRNMVSFVGQRYAERLAPVFAEYYAQAGSWDGVESLMASLQDAERGKGHHGPPQPMLDGPGGPRRPALLLRPEDFEDERLLLLDAGGKIVADSDPEGPALALSSDDVSRGAPVIVGEQQVGTLVVSSSLGALPAYQNIFLGQVNILLLTATVAIVVVVIVVSAFQARRIVAPVRALAEAAQRISTGDLSQRIPVTSQDELGEMATAFNTMAAELEQQQELRHRAMADIAHELRTPLSVLQITLESLEDGLAHPTHDVIAGLQSDVAHLHRLVEDLRMLSLVDAGELAMEAEPVEMGCLVRDVVRRVSGAAHAKSIDMATHLPDTPLRVVGDSQRLTQVLLNLLTNALEHTPTGGRVTTDAHQVEREVQVSVRDTGEGIPGEDLPHIFERFYRADEARSPETGSSGLGLSIARSLVEAHGGRIWAESVEGAGSTFTFALPLAEEA
jgi:signal transduction histidine kinase